MTYQSQHNPLAIRKTHNYQSPLQFEPNSMQNRQQP